MFLRCIIGFVALVCISGSCFAGMISDVTADTGLMPFQAEGPFSGVDSEDHLNDNFGDLGPFAFDFKFDVDDSPDNFDFEDEDGTTGTIFFDSAVSGPFALALKAGRNFSYYFFDPIGDTPSGPVSSITLHTTENIATNPGNGKPLGLSRASVYVQVGGEVGVIPEPGSLALWALGSTLIIGVGYRRRR